MPFMKEVTSMKTFITITTMVVLTLAVGLAYADEFPIGNTKDVGTELYDSAFRVHDTSSMRTEALVNDERFALPDDDVIASLATMNDTGSRIYADAFEKGDVAMADRGVKGSAAGGMAKDDERTIIWDNLLGAPGGSDLP
jgi:hypothetical protein